MSKKCKFCGATLNDAARICSSCNTLNIEGESKIELSRDQMRELSEFVSELLEKRKPFLWGMTWRVGSIILGILGLMGVLTGFSIWDSFERYKNTTTEDIKTSFESLDRALSNQVESAHVDIAKDVATKFHVFAGDASNQIASAYSAVTNEITSDFQTPRIRKTVEDVAEGQAKEILQASVQPEVDKFRDEAEFIRLCSRARAYDFRAYRKLLDVSSQTNEDAFDARETLGEIDRSLQKDRSFDAQLNHKLFVLVAGTNWYSGPFTTDELAFWFPLIAVNDTADNRAAFINQACDLNLPGFLPLFIKFLTNEPDLGVADRVTIAISKLTNLDWHPHDVERLGAWWQAHQNDFSTWPYSDFANADRNFRVGNYRAALESFGRVLKMDPTADMSRAIAILCDCEINDTNTAVTLAKGFKLADGRWAELAKARLELESGSTSNATVQLANIANNNPTMLYLPKQGEDLWKKVDWQSFDKLTTSAKP